MGDNIYRVVQAHKWETFCLHPTEVIVPLVHEFCANFPGGKPDGVIVRRVPVIFGPENIRGLFDLVAVEDGYFPFLQKGNSKKWLQQLINRLYVAGTNWDILAQKAYTFKRINLLPKAKVWYHFLQSRLLPTLHIQTVSKDRAVLLYCILEGIPIDVGQILHDKLCQCLQSTSRHLWFPALITNLCLAAGVVCLPNEDWLKISGPITPFTIERMTQERGVRRPSRGDPQPSHVASSSSTPSATTLLEQWLEHLENTLNTMRQEQKLLWKYLVERDDILDENLQSQFKKFKSFPKFQRAILDDAELNHAALEEAQQEENDSQDGGSDQMEKDEDYSYL